MAEGTARGSWKDRLKQAAAQGRTMADQARTALAEQQDKRTQQWAADPATLWVGKSTGVASRATGMSAARYRITKDRVWVDSGLLGVRSEQVPMWAVKDIDVRQSVLQRGKDVGDVVLRLDDPTYGVDPAGALDLMGDDVGSGTTSGEVVLDDVEGPYAVQELLAPLVREARKAKVLERQTQVVHLAGAGTAAAVAGQMGYGAAQQAQQEPTVPAHAAAEPVDIAARLRELAALRDEGLLTDEEFAAQKTRLLAP